MSKRDTAPPNPLSKVQELSPDCTPRSTCYGPLWCQLIALECSSLFKVSLSFSNASFAVHEITPGMALTEGRELTLVEFADEQEPQKRQLSIWPKRERLMEVQKWGDLLLLSGTTTVHPGLHIWSYDLAAGKQRWQSQLGQLKSQRHARSVPPPFEDRLKLKAIALIARKKLVDWRNRCMTSSVGCSGREGPALPQELSFLLQKRQACAGSPDCKQDSLEAFLWPKPLKVKKGAPMLTTSASHLRLGGQTIFRDPELLSGPRGASHYTLESHAQLAEGGIARVAKKRGRYQINFEILVRTNTEGRPIGAPVRFGDHGAGQNSNLTSLTACTKKRCLLTFPGGSSNTLEAQVIELTPVNLLDSAKSTM